MDTSFSKVYLYESKPAAVFKILILVFIIMLIFYILHKLQKPEIRPLPSSVSDIIRHNKIKIDTACIFICVDEKIQLENLNLVISHGNGLPPRLFNIAVNPTVIESSIDGTMAKKKTVNGKNIYKIQLPFEVPLEKFILDMSVSKPHSVFVFLENRDGVRTWEKNIVVGRGRYHEIEISSIKIL